MKLTDYAANAEADALGKLLNGGRILILDGKTILAECYFGDPAFGIAEKGKIVAHEIKKGTGKASGKADSFQCVASSGENVMSGTSGKVGSGADLILTDTEIKKYAEVTITSFSHLVVKESDK